MTAAIIAAADVYIRRTGRESHDTASRKPRLRFTRRADHERNHFGQINDLDHLL